MQLSRHMFKNDKERSLQISLLLTPIISLNHFLFNTCKKDAWFYLAAILIDQQFVTRTYKVSWDLDTIESQNNLPYRGNLLGDEQIPEWMLRRQVSITDPQERKTAWIFCSTSKEVIEVGPDRVCLQRDEVGKPIVTNLVVAAMCWLEGCERDWYER